MEYPFLPSTDVTLLTMPEFKQIAVGGDKARFCLPVLAEPDLRRLV